MLLNVDNLLSLLQTQFVMELSIFLVHGTFARDAKWTQKDSKLRRTLGEKLKTDNFEPVPWTGENTTTARKNGAAELRSKLRESLTKNPSSRHIVIGHSHGGTIALRTVAEPEFANNVSVILLSTPILVPRKRVLSSRLESTLAMGTYFSATFGLALSVALMGNAFPSMQTPPSGLVVGTSMIVALGTLLLLYRYLRGLTDLILAENSYPIPQDIQLLIVRESADEASSFLGAFQLCSRVVSMIFRGIEFAVDALERWTKKAATVPLKPKTLIPNLVLTTAALGAVWFILDVLQDKLHMSFSTVVWPLC